MNRLFNVKILLTIFPLFISISLSAKLYNILSYGAKPDTAFTSTGAIQAAIDECSQNNGGKVIIPVGDYKSGTIYFKSNVTLHLERGATLYGSTRLADYPENLPGYTFYRKGTVKRALIYAEKCSNISIEGEGTIDGQGGAFLVTIGSTSYSYSVRPYVIWMIESKNVRVEGIRLRNSPFWMQHYLACDQLYIHNIDIYNHCNKNNDMIDIDGCHDVRVSDITGDSDDDGITLKSISGRANENVVITNCILASHCNALKMGTESNGGFKNIAISNIVVRSSVIADHSINGRPNGNSGIALEMVDGGVLDGVVISNIRINGPDVPIFIRLGNRARPYYDGQKIENVGVLRDVSISNVTAINAKKTGCSITGIAGYPVEHISLSHISIEFEGGGSVDDFARQIPEEEQTYPDQDMFGVLPSYGFYIRHAHNIRLDEVRLTTKGGDLRPALFLSDVKEGDFDALRIKGSAGNYGAIAAENSSEIRINGCRIEGQSNSLLYLKGNCNTGVSLTNNLLTNIKSLYVSDNKGSTSISQYGNMK